MMLATAHSRSGITLIGCVSHILASQLGAAYEGNDFGNQLGTDDGWLPARNASIVAMMP
ncbi:hypothetical protein SAMN05216525_1743 [Bradyrhizobium sp. Gha]|nr:hypothetical protein SAMN05216525_1743 [Bradyrhizobium sp. Gha]